MVSTFQPPGLNTKWAGTSPHLPKLKVPLTMQKRQEQLNNVGNFTSASHQFEFQVKKNSGTNLPGSAIRA